MIDQSPILIAGPPRTGTTMLAGLIFKHGGFWIGRSRTTMYPGTNSNFGSENIDIKDIMKAHAKKIGYRNWELPLPEYDFKPYEVDIIKAKIEKFVPENTRWIVKTSWTLIFSDFWMKAYPEAKWLFTWRNVDGIVASMNCHPGMKSHKNKFEFTKELMKKAAYIKKAVNGFTVFVKDVSRKDYKHIKDMFDYLDMKSNKKVINNWLQPELMS